MKLLLTFELHNLSERKKKQNSFFVVGKNHLSDPFTLDFHEEQIGYCKSSLIRLFIPSNRNGITTI